MRSERNEAARKNKRLAESLIILVALLVMIAAFVYAAHMAMLYI